MSNIFSDDCFIKFNHIKFPDLSYNFKRKKYTNRKKITNSYNSFKKRKIESKLSLFPYDISKLIITFLSDIDIVYYILVFEIENYKLISELKIQSINCIDNDLKHISQLNTLRFLDLSNSKIIKPDFELLIDLKLEYLNLTNCHLNNTSIDSISKITNLEYLNLSRCSLKQISLINLTNLTKLRYLILSECDMVESKLIWLKQLKKLRYLDLSGNTELEIGPESVIEFKNLSYIDLKLTNIDDYSLICISKLNKLIYLNIYGCDNITNIGIKFLLKLINLKYLNLSFCTKITHFEIYLTNLEYLSISNCYSINNYNTLKYLTNLQKLTITESRINDHTLSNLKKLNKLTHLDISSCQQIKGEGFKYLPQSLLFLNISFCLNIKNNTLQSLPSNIERLEMYFCQNSIEPLSSLTKLNYLDIRRSSYESHILKEIINKFPKNVIIKHECF